MTDRRADFLHRLRRLLERCRALGPDAPAVVTAPLQESFVALEQEVVGLTEQLHRDALQTAERERLYPRRRPVPRQFPLVVVPFVPPVDDPVTP
jgi:hypothetical protein